MKSTMTKLMLVLAFGWVLFGSALAGDLEPPGPPAPTMVTLQEIYDACTAGGGGGDCGVPKTGQTGCWNALGAPIACSGTGQDGEYQAGVSVSPRFTHNFDGTVKDNLTGLTWLRNANCFGARSWTDALTDANTLSHGACSLTDGSVDGDWRLSNLTELQSLIDYQNSVPALPTGHPFAGVLFFYWSSTTFVDGPNNAWIVDLDVSGVFYAGKNNTYGVWPVRGGQ